MKNLVGAVLLCACATPVFSADVGVSISVGQPGFYGQIEIGNMPKPRVVYAQPVVVAQTPEYVAAPPIYLHVPPGHEKHWRKHCAEYHACGRPVYFVRHDWYDKVYVPGYQHRDERGGDRERGHDRGHGHGNGHHEGRDHDDDRDRRD